MRGIILCIVLLTLLGAGGCAHVEPYEFQPTDEIPAGPGLFSGEDGEFVILRR